MDTTSNNDDDSELNSTIVEVPEIEHEEPAVSEKNNLAEGNLHGTSIILNVLDYELTNIV